MEKIKVLIVDDHTILRMGLTSLLNSNDDFTVIGDAESGQDGIAKALRLRPDVVIMDLVMPDMDGVETTRELLSRDPSFKILILTTFDTSDGISRALAAGALGAIMKNCDFGELARAIRTVADGKRHVSEEIERIFSEDPPVDLLSPRQAEILGYIIKGLSNPEIAKLLGIGLYMVKEHVKALFQKIGASNRAEAIAIALRKQLVKA